MGLLDGYPGLGAGGNIDLNQLVRPPDPLGAALGEISQRLAVAGQASRLPTSTLGAIGSALGGASTAAQTAQTQYLDQAIKLQTLKRSLQQMGFDQTTMDFLMKKWVAQQQGGGGAAPASAVPGVPRGAAAVAPAAAAPGAPLAAPASGAGGSDAFYGEPSVQPPAYVPGMKTTGLLGNGSPGPLDTLVAQGGAGAAAMPSPFRLASLVGPAGAGDGSGAGAGADPASLAGLLAPDDKAAADPLAGLLATDAPIQPGGPDTLVRSDAGTQLSTELASARSGYTVPQLYQLAVEAGYPPGEKAAMAAAIGMGESSGNPGAHNTKGEDSYGLMQLNAKAHGDLARTFDPLENMRNSLQVSKGGTDWSPWSVYKNGDYKQYLPDARAAAGDNTGGAPDTVLSNTGGGLPIMKAQYAPGGGPPAGSSAAAVEGMLGGAPAPALVGTGSGVIPGLGMTPQEVAILNAMSSLAGHTNPPLKEFLDLYYKSPEYLRQSEQEKAAGQRAITQPSDIAIAHAKALDDRVTKQIEQGGAAMLGLAPNGILVPDGQGGQKRVQATIAQAVRAANGLAVPELGIAGMYPDTKGGATAGGQPTRSAGPIAGEPTGTLPSGYQWQTTPDGKTTAQPIPNTPEAAAAEALAKTRAVADRGLQMSRDIVVQNSDRLENMVKDSALPVTGAGGSLLSRLGGTAANDARVLIETMRARMSLDQLNALRAASPTGGALGNVSNAEGDRLAAAMSNLDQSQSKEQFLFNLRRAKEAYVDAVHGPGAWKQMSDEPVMKAQSQPREWKEGQILNYPDGSQHQLTNGQWIAIKPPTQR